ncbi:MAG: cytochrome b/b6 domain-containing protein [Chromatiaceae bacterium]|nr:cytochrome b/b6 domain-containing protein [Chromatiaceae bacterium]
MNADSSRDIQVWDPALRLFHWTLAGSFLVAYVTEDDWQWLHVNAGYLIGILILLRLVWGFVGPRYARFSDFVRTPREVLAYARDAVRFRAPRYVGHNPAAGAMVVALLVCLMLTVLTGIALYGATDFAGPLAGLWRGEVAADVLEEIHEAGANLTLFLVVLHLGGVLFTSREQGENLVKSMITGRKKGAQA